MGLSLVRPALGAGFSHGHLLMCCDPNRETEVAGWGSVLVLPADFSEPCLLTVYHSNGFENSFKLLFFHLVGPAVCWSSGRKKGQHLLCDGEVTALKLLWNVWKDGLRLMGIVAVWTVCSRWCLVFRWMFCVQLSLAVTGWGQVGARALLWQIGKVLMADRAEGVELKITKR